jgi:hypothetical protein
MRNSRPQLLDNLFNDASSQGQNPLSNIQQRAYALLKLNRAIKALLPKPLQTQCRVGNYRQGVLVLEVASANWMMLLRYEQPTLLSTLRAQILPSLASIDIRINPSLTVKMENIAQNSIKSSPSTHEINSRHLSEQSAAALRELAERSPEKLKKSLERLAKWAGESTHAASQKTR